MAATEDLTPPAASRAGGIAASDAPEHGGSVAAGAIAGISVYKRLLARALAATNFPAVIAGLAERHRQALDHLAKANETTFEGMHSADERFKRYARWQQAFATIHSRTTAIESDETAPSTEDGAVGVRSSVDERSAAADSAGTAVVNARVLDKGLAGMTRFTDQAAERSEQSRRMEVELRSDDGEGQDGFPSGQALETLKARAGPLDPVRPITPNSIVAAWTSVGLPTNKISTTGFFEQAGERSLDRNAIWRRRTKPTSVASYAIFLGLWSLPARAAVFE